MKITPTEARILAETLFANLEESISAYLDPENNNGEADCVLRRDLLEEMAEHAPRIIALEDYAEEGLETCLCGEPRHVQGATG